MEALLDSDADTLHGGAGALANLDKAAQGAAVGEEAGGRGQHLLDDLQVVLGQGGAGGRDVDDALGEAHHGGQLDVAVQVHDIHLGARPREMGARDRGVLRGDAHRAQLAV